MAPLELLLFSLLAFPPPKNSMASSAVRVSRFLSPPSIFLLFLTFLTFSSSSPPNEIPYAEHCNSIVPESIPTHLLVHSGSFQLPHGYFSGGVPLLDSDSTSGRSTPKSFRFRAEHLHQTQSTGIVQVRGTLILHGGNTRTQWNHTSSDGSLTRYTSTVGKEAIFELSGFWSKSSGKLCMVGRGLLKHAAAGSSLHLPAVLKLNYPEKSNINTSLVSGTVESLDATNSPNHFSSIQILAYAQKKYEYTSQLQATKSCSRHEFDHEESVEFDYNSYCPRLRTLGGQSFRLDYGSDCSGPNCGPFGTSSEIFMSLNLIECTEEGKLHFYIGFSNLNKHPYNRLFVPQKSLVAEGFWDPRENRLCVVACRVLHGQGDSLATASVGDCTIGFSLWFPHVLSIKSTSSAVGHIWSEKNAGAAGYFGKVSFSSFGDNFGLVPGLKYRYTRLDTVKNLCVVNDDVATLDKRGYPDGRSFDKMKFGFDTMNSNGRNTWGQATPISVGETHHQNADPRGYVTLVSVDELYYEDIPFYRAKRPLQTSPEQTHWNVSYKISYAFPGSTSDEDVPTEISAEGIYNANTGKLCMVGCQYPSYAFAKNQGKGVNNTMDCEILINVQLPPLNPELEERFNGKIESTRKKSDPLFFNPVEVFSYSFYGTGQTVWRMDMEIIMAVISLTLSCIFIRVQFYHLKKHFPSISITMLVVLTLGHMIPLMLNFGALFYKNRNAWNIPYRSSGWLEANEVIVRVMTMVAFLLHFRLLQVAWSSRSAEEGKKGLWVAEKRALMLCLSLYLAGGLIAWFAHTRSHEIRQHRYSDYLVERYHSLWEDLTSYCGLILDGFLLPQILFNIFWNSKDKALNPFFYVGTTILRAVPHWYDAYRSHHDVPHLNWSYIYASHDRDLYSTAWNIIIPCQGVLFASLIYLQQRFGGDHILPKRFRKPDEYEMVVSP